MHRAALYKLRKHGFTSRGVQRAVLTDVRKRMPCAYSRVLPSRGDRRSRAEAGSLELEHPIGAYEYTVAKNSELSSCVVSELNSSNHSYKSRCDHAWIRREEYKNLDTPPPSVHVQPWRCIVYACVTFIPPHTKYVVQQYSTPEFESAYIRDVRALGL